MELTLVPCPLCGQTATFLDVHVPDTDRHIHKYGALYAGKAKSEWKICGRCGFVHQNPRPSAKALGDFYRQARYHPSTVEADAQNHLAFARWYYGEKIAFTLRHSGLSGGAVFDIGCGRGGVLKMYEELGWRAYGVEPDPALARFANEQMGLRGVRAGIFDGEYALEEQVDLVFSNHAFEHFAELDEVMRGVVNITKPGGFLFIAIPTYYRNLTPLSKEWMNSAHYSLFTARSLNNLVTRYGFEEVAHTYSGWLKESDDLWYIARYTGRKGDPVQFFEDPQKVARYLGFVNPLRSWVMYPRHLFRKVLVRTGNAVSLLMASPRAFAKKLVQRIGL